MEKKLFEVDNESIAKTKLEHVRDYLEIRARSEYQGDFTKIKKSIYSFLDFISEKSFK
jgi:hypothetical protein